MTVRTITVDFWGTLLFDGPASDDRYRKRRLDEFEVILGGTGTRVARNALERGYDYSAEYLSRVWRTQRDVPVREHVRTILVGADSALPERLGEPTMRALVQAYAQPALLVPPTVDDGARAALSTLRERGYTLALVSNIMRTPGVTLRQLLERYGLLSYFAHTTFSDEVGVRKPHPEIFALTLRAVGGEASAAVHVGDDPILDIEGARASGMRAIHVTRGAVPGVTRGPTPGRSVTADALISKLAALPDAVERLNAGS